MAQQASTLIHSALDDPDIPLSTNELRWLGSSVYNLGCVAYQRGCFSEGEPLLAIACEELKIWSFAAETEQGIVARTEEVIHLSNIRGCSEALLSNTLCEKI